MDNVYEENIRTARKIHFCEAYGGKINLGERYCEQTVADGEFYTRRFHLTCKKVVEYYCDNLATEDELDYADAEEAIADNFCKKCEHNNNGDCTQNLDVWDCPHLQKMIENRT